MDNIFQHLVLFLIGGAAYYSIELLWRGYSHITMFVLGGLCFITIGSMSQHYLINGRNILIQLLIYSSLITFLELVFGLVFNIRFGMDIWDYRDLRFNFMGQISLAYSILWFFLSLPTIGLYNYLAGVLFRR